MKPEDPEYSLVIPVYNNAPTLELLVAGVREVFAGIGTHEIILVDDASTDASWQLIRTITAEDCSVVGIRLRRNIGQHRAVLVGFGRCRGAVVITMDADLQQRPEDIRRLLQGLQNHLDVVIADYGEMQTSFWRKAGSLVVNGLLCLLHRKPLSLKITSFKAIRSPVVHRLARYVNHAGYLAVWLLRTVNHERMANIRVPHHRRTRGKSSYSLRRLLELLLLLVRQFLQPDRRVPSCDVFEIIDKK